MKAYIGTKIIKATPMDRLAYILFRKWDLPNDENGEDEGYLVEYMDGGKPNIEGYEGYVSWTPKEQFDNAYRETSGLSFGLAIEAMKKGFKVSRYGWDGKGMFCILVNGGIDVLLKRGSAYARALDGITESIDILSHIDMYTTNSEGRKAMLPGWLASQSDMLADDWSIID